MKVYEIKLKLYLLENINVEDIQTKISKIIDSCFAKNKEWLDFHNKNEFKNYCFDSPYPLAKDKVYKKDNVYTLTIRTISKDLSNYLSENLHTMNTKLIKCLKTETKIIPKKRIEKIYSITPIILKNNEGYWKDFLSVYEFEERIKVNLIKKYNSLNNTKIDENFNFFSYIEFNNKKPCSFNYKGKKLLGDKVNLFICDDEISQSLAYMTLGTGIGEMNSRGAGMVNFRYF